MLNDIKKVAVPVPLLTIVFGGRCSPPGRTRRS